MSNQLRPLVSVVMPAYNAERFLSLAIASVRAQSLQEWELVVVNDGSSDRTLEYLRAYAGEDSRVKVVSLRENGGIARARTIGVSHAKGRYIGFLDSDDVWLPRKLESQVDSLQRYSASMVCSAIGFLTEDDVQLDSLQGVPAVIDYRSVLRSTPIVTSTVLYDRARVPGLVFPAVGHEDYACWLGLLRSGDLTVYGEGTPLALYRLSGSSISSNRLRSASWTWRILRKQEAMGLVAAAGAFVSYAATALRKRAVRARGVPATSPWGGFDEVLRQRDLDKHVVAMSSPRVGSHRP